MVVMCDGVGVGVGGDSWGLWGGRGEERREWMGGVRAGMGNVDGWDCLVALCEVVELHGGGLRYRSDLLLMAILSIYYIVVVKRYYSLDFDSLL